MYSWKYLPFICKIEDQSQLDLQHLHPPHPDHLGELYDDVEEGEYHNQHSEDFLLSTVGGKVQVAFLRLRLLMRKVVGVEVDHDVAGEGGQEEDVQHHLEMKDKSPEHSPLPTEKCQGKRMLEQLFLLGIHHLHQWMVDHAQCAGLVVRFHVVLVQIIVVVNGPTRWSDHLIQAEGVFQKFKIHLHPVRFRLNTFVEDLLSQLRVGSDEHSHWCVRYELSAVSLAHIDRFHGDSPVGVSNDDLHHILTSVGDCQLQRVLPLEILQV